MFILKIWIISIAIKGSIEFSQIIVNNRHLGEKTPSLILGYANRTRSNDDDNEWISPDFIKSMLITKRNFTKYSDFYKNGLINSDRNNYFNVLLRNATATTSTSPAIIITKSSVTDKPIEVNNEFETNLLKNTLIDRMVDVTTIDANRIESTIREPYIYSTHPTVRVSSAIYPKRTITTTIKPRIRNKKRDNLEQHLNFLRKYFTFNCSIMNDLRESHDKNISHITTTIPSITATTSPINFDNKKNVNRNISKTNYSLTNKTKVNYPRFTVKTTQRPIALRPTQTVNRVNLKSTTATTKPTTKSPSKKSATKNPVKTVYVEPPGFGLLENILENFYNIMEDQLTSEKVVRRKSGKSDRKKQRTSGTAKNSKYASRKITKQPLDSENKAISRTTDQAIGGGSSTFNKKVLTTNIHVTSEYKPPSTPVNPVSTTTESFEKNTKPNKKPNKDATSDEDDYDYYDFNFDIGEDEADDDDISDEYADEEDEKSSEDEITNSKFKKKNKKKKPIDDSYENSLSEEKPLEDNGGFGSYFSRFSDYFRFPSFGSLKYDDEDGRRSTTPKIDFRKPKYPILYAEPEDENENTPEAANYDETLLPWYYPSYFFQENNDNDIETTIPAAPTGEQDQDENNTEQSWFDWNPLNLFSDAAEEQTTEASADSNWFPNFFDDETEAPSSTTATPPIHPQQQVNWMALISQQLKANSTKSPATTIDSLTPRKKFYDNYQLWRVLPKSSGHVKYLEDYRLSQPNSKLQWWKGPTLKGTTDVLVSPKMVQKFKDYLDYENIKYDVLLRDVQQSILYENPKITKREQIELEVVQGHPLTWYRYHRFGDILKYIYYVQRKYSKYVELIHIGESFEGRPLIVMRIAYEPGNDNTETSSKISKFIERRKRKQSNKQAIFIEAGTHAREWTTSAVLTNMIEQLVKKISVNDTEGESIRSVDWYLMPMLNPDGYEYSHLYDRFWRKTRSRHSNRNNYGIISAAFNWFKANEGNPADTCFGTDLNRNWKSNWNSVEGLKNPCGDYFGGPNAFSEPETRALSNFLNEYKRNIKIYVSLHSYGNFLTYSHLKNGKSDEELLEMALVSIQSLKEHSVKDRYSVDKSNEMIYKRSGTADSYAMRELGIKYSYTLELREKDGKGFLTPPSNIIRMAKDTFDIVKGMVDYL